MKKKRIKKLPLLLAAALLTVSMTGVCTFADNAADKEPISVLHFFVKEGSGPSGAFWKAADRYQESHPDEELEFMFVDSSTYSELLNIMMAGDELPDVWLSKGDLLPTLVDEGLIQPVGPFLEADPEWENAYKEDVFLDSTYKENVWGFPYQIQLNCVGFYNASIFEECGIDHWPDTMQELIEDCGKIKAAGYTPIALGNKDQWPAASVLLNNLIYKYTDRAWVTSIMENQGASFTDPELIRAFEGFRELAQCFNEDMNSITQDEMESMYYNRQAAMFFCGAWAVGIVIQNCPEEVLKDTHVALMPAVEGEKGTTFDTAGGVGWYYVFRSDLSGEKLERALSFVKAVTCGEYAQDALSEGYFSAAVESEDALDSQKPHPLFEEYRVLADQASFCPVLDCTLPPELGTGAMPVDTQKLLTGEMTPEEMAQDLQTIMKANY